jgi:ADP-glucose pyrophosphorylase
MDHVSIGAGASIKYSVVASNCQVGEGCSIEKSRAGPGTRFEDGEKISNEEIGKNL